MRETKSKANTIMLILLLIGTLTLAFNLQQVKTISWNLPDQLTYNTNFAHSPSISSDGSKITFYSADDVDSDAEIFVINLDGSGLKQLTHNTAWDGNPSISGDGSKITYESDMGDHEIFVINSDGSGLKQLTDNTYDEFSPCISGDGSKITFVFIEDIEAPFGDFEIFVINSDGSGLKQLTDNTYDEFSPSISGDGSKIAFSSHVDSDTEIFVINSDGSGLKQLTHNTVSENGPSISGDGSKIAFFSAGDVDNDDEIFVINSDGSGLKQLTHNTYDEWSPSINYDGSKIAFFSRENADSDSEIFVINSDGSGLKQLTYNAASDEYPSISGDGSKITYESDMDGSYEIFVIGEQVQLTVEVLGSGTTSPSLGSYMYYVGSTVSVDATTTEVGWKLDHWSLDSINVGDSNPYMVLMDTDHILTAVFVEAPQSAPIASFVPSHQTRLVNEPVSFDASNSSDPDGNIVSYDWTFGDTSTGSGKTTTHAYQETGDYPVTLTVTDNDDLTDTATTNIHVTDKPVTPGDDVTPPMGSMTINGGVADTNSLSVTLQLLAEDPESGIAYMRFSNDNNFWTEWEEYATSKSWNLEPGEGTKEVYVQFQNNVHLDSDIYSDTIVFASEKSESSLSVSVSPTTLTVGENTSISGILSPPLEGTSVKLECRTNGGTWATIETVTTGSDGGYLYVWTPTTAGTYEIKVSWEGDENTLSCQNIGQLITTKLSVPAAFPLWIFAPVGGGISGVTAILVYLRRRKSKQKQISGVSEIPLPKQKIKKVISPEELKKLPNLPAKCDNTILALNNYIEDPSLANDREAWEVLKELITASEKIDEEYAELFEIRNTIARLRRERNYSKKAGLETDASKYTAYIQSNYQDLIRIIKKIRKKFINLGG